MIHLQICIKDEEESKMKIRNGEIFFFDRKNSPHTWETDAKTAENVEEIMGGVC